MSFPGQIIGIGHAATVYATRPILRQVHQLICILEGQRTKQHGVDGAEDGGIRSDAQGESEDADGRDERIAEELAKPKAKIIEKIFEQASESVHRTTPILCKA